MIRYVIADDQGTIVRNGHASSVENAFLQRRAGERAFVLTGDDFGMIDTTCLMINFNNMLICRKPGVTTDIQGDGAPVLEIVEDDSHA